MHTLIWIAAGLTVLFTLVVGLKDWEKCKTCKYKKRWLCWTAHEDCFKNEQS